MRKSLCSLNLRDLSRVSSSRSFLAGNKSHFPPALTNYVSEIEQSSKEKFCAISNELSEIRAIQKQNIENQNRNWKILEEQFATIEGNFHILPDCTQTMFSNQQINLNFDTAASLLNVVYADKTSYKTALYASKTNVLSSIPTLLDQRLPMSLVP